MFSQEFFRIAQPTHFYQFNTNATPAYTTDAATGQEYMDVAPAAIVAAGARPSTFMFAPNPATDTAIRAQARHVGGGPNTYILGALYYNAAGPLDYQYGISETGKPGETHLECANRGLIEELGLQFTGTPAAFSIFQKRGGTQNCQVFVVHASEVQPVGASVPQAIVTRMNMPDPTGIVNKAQVVICGTLAELQALGASITHKPVQPGTREFYDAPIKGFVIRRA